MTNQKFFTKTLKNEIPIFVRVLRAVPEQNLSYRPAEKSKSAWELVKDTFGSESACFPVFLKQGTFDFSELAIPEHKTVSDVTIHMEKSLTEVLKLVENMSTKEWQAKAIMKSNGQVMWETTKSDMAWGLLLDLIHHRGQLSVYLRPMGGKVPSIYGPSADDPGQQ